MNPFYSSLDFKINRGGESLTLSVLSCSSNDVWFPRPPGHGCPEPSRMLQIPASVPALQLSISVVSTCSMRLPHFSRELTLYQGS